MPDKQSCSCFHLKLCFLLFSCISCLSYKGLSVFLCLLVYGSLSASNWTGTTSQSWGPICKWCSTRSKCGHVNKCRSTIKVPDIWASEQVTWLGNLCVWVSQWDHRRDLQLHTRRVPPSCVCVCMCVRACVGQSVLATERGCALEGPYTQVSLTGQTGVQR